MSKHHPRVKTKLDDATASSDTTMTNNTSNDSGSRKQAKIEVATMMQPNPNDKNSIDNTTTIPTDEAKTAVNGSTATTKQTVVTCPICIQDFSYHVEDNQNNANSLVFHPKCHHTFCLRCMDRLLLSTAGGNASNNDTTTIKTTTFGHCPMCRTEMSYFDLQYCSTHENVVALDSTKDDLFVSLLLPMIGGSIYLIADGDNDGIGFGSIHFPTAISKVASCVDICTKKNGDDNEDDNNSSFTPIRPYLNIKNITNSGRGSDYFENLQRTLNDDNNVCFEFQNIKYHPPTKTFQGDIVFLDRTVFRYIFSFSDNWNCIARGIILILDPPPTCEVVDDKQRLDQEADNIGIIPGQQQFTHGEENVEVGRMDHSLSSINYDRTNDITSQSDENNTNSAAPTRTMRTPIKKVIQFGYSSGIVYRRIVGGCDHPTVGDTTPEENQRPQPSVASPSSSNNNTAILQQQERSQTTLIGSSSVELPQDREDVTVVKKYSTEILWGNIFCQSLQIGLASYHFIDTDNSYISYETMNAAISWPPLDNGRPIPSQVKFRNVQYDCVNHIFRGNICWYDDYNTSWQGYHKWIYEIKFDTNYLSILSGTVQSVIYQDDDDDDCENASITKKSPSTTIKEMSRFGVSLIYCNAALFHYFHDIQQGIRQQYQPQEQSGNGNINGSNNISTDSHTLHDTSARTRIVNSSSISLITLSPSFRRRNILFRDHAATYDDDDENVANNENTTGMNMSIMNTIRRRKEDIWKRLRSEGISIRVLTLLEHVWAGSLRHDNPIVDDNHYYSR